MLRNLGLFLSAVFLLATVGHADNGGAGTANPPSGFSGETISLKTGNGGVFKAYRTGPRGAKRGILLLHEWWGLNDSTRRYADYLGEAGYRVIAIDLYDGKVASSVGQAQEYMMSVNQEAANAKHRAGLNALKAPGRKLITMGWGFGGNQSLQAGLADPASVAAIVIYDGALPNDPKAIKPLKAPVLGIFAKDNAVIPPSEVKAFETAMKQANKMIKIHFYDGSSNVSNPAFDRHRDSIMPTLWKETQIFLNKYVK